MSQYVATARGPLPLTVTFTPEADGPASLFVAGSAYSTTPNVEIGVLARIDGTPLGIASVWSNGAETHRALVPNAFAVELDAPWSESGDPPSYEVTLQASGPETISDSNDLYTLILTV